MSPRESRACVDFYYAIGSRYSYLASTQLDRLAHDCGCSVRWHPLNSRALMTAIGSDPFEGRPVPGQYDWSYRERDASRWAALYGVPFIEPKGRVEFDPELLALAATAAKRLGRVEQYCRTLFCAMFAEAAVTRIDRAECLRRARRCAIDEQRFEAELDSRETAADLAATLRTALERGVFGVPSFVVDDQLFWGNDRLVLLRHHLSQR